MSDFATESNSLWFTEGSGIVQTGLSAVSVDNTDELQRVLKFPVKMQIFSMKYLSGLLFLYEPVKNKGKKASKLKIIRKKFE